MTSETRREVPAPQWPSDAGAPPRFATPRDPSWATDGPLIAVIARALGKPLLPWQQYVADVATEYRITHEGIREYHYRTIVVSVPRQTGKTTLLHALGIYRAMVLGHDFFYTAQTGKDARARWGDLVKAMRKSDTFRTPLKEERIKIALRGGSEHVEFPNGSVFQAFAPTEDSLHGYTPPTVVLDESFAHSASKGEMLMGAISPAQQTIRAKQVWIVSTMGHADSTFLHDWIDRAVEGAPRVAGFYWGAGDEHDPYNLDDIPKYHPGVGFVLNDGVLTAGDVLAEVENNSRAEYERAFANRRTLTASHLIAPAIWATLGPDEDTPAPVMPADLAGVTLTYDVAADRTAAAIAATWQLDDGRVAGRLLAAAPGLTWVADTIDRLRPRPDAIVAVDHGPVLEVTDQLRRLGHDVTTLNEREYATACGHFLTLIDTAGLVHDGDDHLARSVCGLVTRAGVVDGVAFSRRHSVGDSSPAIALVGGLWHSGRADHGVPLIYWGNTA